MKAKGRLRGGCNINPKKGESHTQSKLTEAQVLEIRAHKGPARELARRYGVAESTINRARNGTRWKCVKPFCDKREPLDDRSESDVKPHHE